MKHLLIFILLIILTSSCFVEIPSTMRLQNGSPQHVTGNKWVACQFVYHTPGGGTSFSSPSNMSIDKFYNGGMLTINMEFSSNSPVQVRIVGEGGKYPLEQRIETIAEFGSIVYPIENVQDTYSVEVFSEEEVTMNLCRVSLTANGR